MKLSFLFSQMQSGELRQLAVVDNKTGLLKPDKYKAVVDLMNAGMIELHTRFKLKIGEVVVPISKDVEVYDMAAVDPLVKTRFLQIHDVKDSCGRPIAFNDYSSHLSVHFTSRTVLHVPKHVRDFHGVSSITVQYKAMPRMIGLCDDPESLDPDVVDVDLDYPYATALCLYVASRLHGTVGLQDSTYAINSYVSLYQAELNRLSDDGVALSYVGNHDEAFHRNWP